MKRLFGIAMAMLLVSACASTPAAKATADATTSAAAIASAEAARKKAASVGHEWRDTGKMIKKAKELMESQKFDEAIKVAGKAEAEGELGYQQYMREKDRPLPKL